MRYRIGDEVDYKGKRWYVFSRIELTKPFEPRSEYVLKRQEGGGATWPPGGGEETITVATEEIDGTHWPVSLIDNGKPPIICYGAIVETFTWDVWKDASD